MKFRIIIEEEEDGPMSSNVPPYRPAFHKVRQGKEAIENIQDATRRYLESQKKHDELIPSPIDEEIVEVAI